uniref:Uncharacterized protein n=1 Tax=Haptolina brevifila TaxID=156173 RepID=A0A7S2MRQ1_9EUKA
MATQRPKTGASVLSSIESMSIASRGSNESLTGSQLNALVQRRSMLRQQMAVVENHLSQLPPPSTAASQSLSGFPPKTAAPPLPSCQITPVSGAGQGPSHGPVIPVPARELPGGLRPIQPRMTPMASHEDTLPAAMRAGRYAFWPKRLPGANASRSSRGIRGPGVSVVSQR